MYMHTFELPFYYPYSLFVTYYNLEVVHFEISNRKSITNLDCNQLTLIVFVIYIPRETLYAIYPGEYCIY